MNNKFNEITEQILKAIGEQNKRFEYIEEKIEKVIVEKVKEFLSSEDINLSPETQHLEFEDSLLLKGVDRRVKEVEEKLTTYNLKDKKIKQLEENLDKTKLLLEKQSKKIDILEEKIKLFLSNSDMEKEPNSENKNLKIEKNKNLAIKKDGKIVNITINI